MEFSPDSQTFAALHKDGALSLWNGVTGTFVSQMKGCRDRAFLFSPDGRLVVTMPNLAFGKATQDNARVWDSKTGALRSVLDTDGNRVDFRFSPTGDRLLATVYTWSKSFAYLWDGTTGELIAILGSDTRVRQRSIILSKWSKAYDAA